MKSGDFTMLPDAPRSNEHSILAPVKVSTYYVFLASPGDVKPERDEVRNFFASYNQTDARHDKLRFEVVDWENYATAGIGRPQELITAQTLARFRNSLALVIGIMGERFGSPSGTHESGTQEEFEWALAASKDGYPEIKYFFRNVTELKVPIDPEQRTESLAQWEKVRAFRKRFEDERLGLHVTFHDTKDFRERLSADLRTWLNDPGRPWNREPRHAPVQGDQPPAPPPVFSSPPLRAPGSRGQRTVSVGVALALALAGMILLCTSLLWHWPFDRRPGLMPGPPGPARVVVESLGTNAGPPERCRLGSGPLPLISYTEYRWRLINPGGATVSVEYDLAMNSKDAPYVPSGGLPNGDQELTVVPIIKPHRIVKSIHFTVGADIGVSLAPGKQRPLVIGVCHKGDPDLRLVERSTAATTSN